MGRRIRVYEPNIVYSAVIRTVDQQFLVVPDHDRKHPLLTAGCPVESFDRFNKQIPDPSVINIVGAAAARAKALASVNIHWTEANSNHLQVGVSASEEQLKNLPDFFRNFFSSVAVKLNKKWKRGGHVFGAPYRPTPCLDEESAEQQLVYSVTNPVKDGLVETIGESPYFTTFRYLARGEKLRFFRIDWDGYYLAGADRKKSHCPQDYLEWLELEIAPVPGQEDWPEHKRQAWARAQVRAVEEETRERLRKEGRGAMGVEIQFRTDPRSRPLNPKLSGGQPLCHASDPELRAAFKLQWRATMSEYYAASMDYRLGMWEREFPDGTFPPPLIKLYLSSHL